MPRARANIIAKFIAQMETGTKWLIRTSEPAEATSPARVSSSGSPAATSAPKARTRIARVTGQENISDFSIASRLAALKSDHSSEAPVGLTCTVSVDSAWSGSLRSSATRTISLVSAPAPPRTTAVRAVLAQAGAGLGCDDVGDAGLGAQAVGDLAEDLASCGVAQRALLGVHDDLDRGAGVAAEVVLWRAGARRRTLNRRPASRRRRAGTRPWGQTPPGRRSPAATRPRSGARGRSPTPPAGPGGQGGSPSSNRGRVCGCGRGGREPSWSWQYSSQLEG